MGDVPGEVIASKIIDAPKPAIADVPPVGEQSAAIVAAPKRDSRPLAERIGAKDGKLSLLALAEAACLSRLFAGIQDPAQALMKMIMGRELGIAPTSSLRAIYITEDGRIGFYAETMAAMLRRHPRYDYRVSENTREACTVAILDRSTGEVLGETRWTLKDDAVVAGLVGKLNWKKYPRALLFARTLTEAVRVHAPDVFAAVPIVPAEDPTDEITPDSDSAPWPLDLDGSVLEEGAPTTMGAGTSTPMEAVPPAETEQVSPPPPPTSPAASILREMLAGAEPTFVAQVARDEAKLPSVLANILAGRPGSENAPAPPPATPLASVFSDAEVRARLGAPNVHVADSIIAAEPDGQVEPESVARELHGLAFARVGTSAMKLWSEVGVRPAPGVRLTGRQARAFVALLPA